MTPIIILQEQAFFVEYLYYWLSEYLACEIQGQNFATFLLISAVLNAINI